MLQEQSKERRVLPTRSGVRRQTELKAVGALAGPRAAELSAGTRAQKKRRLWCLGRLVGAYDAMEGKTEAQGW